MRKTTENTEKKTEKTKRSHSKQSSQNFATHLKNATLMNMRKEKKKKFFTVFN